MEKRELLKYVDHTMLKAFAKWEDIEKLCEESIEYETASICIPQTYIRKVHEKYGDKINICTVVGFPLGYNSTESKVAETLNAISDGANEIDMVINISHMKNGEYEKVKDEIIKIKSACGDKILKVIIETCYLSEDEKKTACMLVSEAKADYIKTSTGFGTGGATIEDVILMRENIFNGVKIKAAGGIKSIEDMERFIHEGCSRLGTSSAIDIYRKMEDIDNEVY